MLCVSPLSLEHLEASGMGWGSWCETDTRAWRLTRVQVP